MIQSTSIQPVSTSEMRDVENWGVSLGVSKLMMMENAGHCIAEEVLKILSRRSVEKRRGVKVAFLAGTGNNGGDAFVAARYLSYWKSRGISIDVFLIGAENDIKAYEAICNWKILRNL